MHQRHPEALENPDCIEQCRKRILSAFAHRTPGRGHKAHHNKPQEGDGETGGNGPLSSDPVRDAAGDRKTKHRGQPAQNREDHGGAGRGLKMIDDVVADIGAESIVGHEPQKLRRENGKKHDFVGAGHRFVIVDGCFNRGETFPKLQLIPDLRLNLVFPDRGKKYQSRDDHQDRGDDEREFNGPETALRDRGIDVIAENEQNSKYGCECAAEVAHDVDDAVGLGTQRLRRDIRHEGDGRVAVHHHEQQHNSHHGNHAEDIIPVEKQRNKRKGEG